MKNPIIPGLNLPARTIYCIGRNYSDHAAEMNSPVPDQPMVFLKPLSALCFEDRPVSLPSRSKEVHHEGELVVAIGKEGKNIPENEAGNYIAGYGPGIDFTARDIQAAAKKKGHPWSVAKGFDQFAPVGTFVSADQLNLKDAGNLELKVNGKLRQSGSLNDMIFSPEVLISYLSEIFTLYPGDLIFTGTPAGVSEVKSGDRIDLKLNGTKLALTIHIE